MKRFPSILRLGYVQLFLWAILPVTFVIIGLAFTGVYVHQRSMRDFVRERDLTVARMTAQHVEDGLAQGSVSSDGEGLPGWLAPFVAYQPTTVTLLVTDGAGRVLAHSDPALVGTDRQQIPGTAEPPRQGEDATIVSNKSDQAVLIAFAPVEGTDWYVSVEEPVDELIGPILRLSSLTPVVAAGAAVLSVLILTFGWRTIVRPLQQLAQAAEQVSWGNFSALAAPVSGVQEIHDLHQALKDMAERIQGYEAGVRDYLAAMTEGQEAERARLARELHDGPVQELIALGQRAEMAQRLIGRGEQEEAEALLTELRNAEMATVQELRRLTRALRPSYLEDLGFIPALEMLAQETRERTAARVTLEDTCAGKRVAPAVELAAYRIAQEALNNALRHAQAKKISIRVRCSDDEVILSIDDNGVGFVLPGRPDVLTQAGHFGLMGMRERATLLGGTLHIDTAPGEGTRITATLPTQPPTR